MTSHHRLVRSVGLAAVLAGLLAAGSTAVAQTPAARATSTGSTTQPSGIGSVWGWVTLRDPSATIQPLAPADQGNSLAETNDVTYDGNGFYAVRFPGIGTTGGVANVTVLGTDPRVCDVSEWYPQSLVAGGSEDEYVTVLCWDDSGAPATAAFTVSYLFSNAPIGRLADLWAGDYTQTDYTPDTEWNFNSTGTPNTIHKNGVGDYRVTLPGLASSRGNVQVGNYGRFTPAPVTALAPSGFAVTQKPSECNVASWAPHGADMRVHVLCRRLNGHLYDSQFELTFTQSEGLEGPSGTNVAYLLANRPTTASYKPASAFRYASPTGKPKVTRSSTGTYLVTLPSMPSGGAAIVTAYGSAKVRCNVTSIRSSGSPQKVGVRCVDFHWQAVDSEFTLSYVH